MCLAVPKQVVKIDGHKALLQDGRWIKLDLVPEVKQGDYLIVSADLAVEKITKTQAKEMSRLINGK